MANPETIILSGKSLCVFRERSLDGTAYPGNIITLTSDGKVQVNATEKTNVARYFLTEQLIGSIRTRLEDNTRAEYIVANRGVVLQTRVAAGADAITVGTALEANSSGGVQAFTDGVVIAYALEDVDNSSGTEEVFIKVEVA